MNTHFVESRPLHCLLSDSVDSEQTLDGSSLESPLPPPPPPPPPVQTLNDLLNSGIVPSESNQDDLLNFDDCRDDQSGSTLFLDVRSNNGEEDRLNSPSLRDGFSVCSSSQLSCTPWDSQGGSTTGTSASGWPNWPSLQDTNQPRLAWSETWSSGADAKTLEPGWSEPWPLNQENETMALPWVYPAWSHETRPATVGAGLSNLGNTCFLNAIIQCFTHLVPLVQGLRSYNHLKPCDSEGFCIFCTLRQHIEFSLASIGTLDTVISPWKLVDNLSNISSCFRRFRQEDAHEFLQCLLDRLGSCDVYLETKDRTLSLVDENLVKQVFGGRLMSKLQCSNCGHCSDTYEPLIDLSLEVDNVDSLHAALESFTKVEKIEDAEIKFICEKCKEDVSVEKQLILDQPPSVATFHLKRFKNDGSYVEKIDKYVGFPLELDLLPYTGGNQNCNVEMKYYLYAIVVHSGLTLASGHYYSYMRAAPDAWYRFDDSKVTMVREEIVLSEEAYILFYAKEGTPWFSSFMDTEKSFLDTPISNSSPKSVLDNIDDTCTSPACADGLITTLEKVTSNSCAGTKSSPFAFTENNCNNNINEVEDSSTITLSTPQRFLTPDLYAEGLPAANYATAERLLPLEKHVPCKRHLDKDLKDADRNQAFKRMKNMPNDWCSKLPAAINRPNDSGSLSCEWSSNTETSSKRNDRPPNARHKPNYSSCMHPMAAGRLC